MSPITRFDHIGITVADLELVTARLRTIAFEVDDLRATVDELATDGYGLVGGIGQYEDAWLMAYVRGPEGLLVALAERIG
jgi:catechol 2,3-dioxygenase-like lactoylglutathione lyase family enzyme